MGGSKKHLHRWIGALIEGMDDEIDEETRARILERCGRSCIPRAFVSRVEAQMGDIEDAERAVDRLGELWGHLERVGDDVYVMYEKCFCPLVNSYPGDLSPTFCNCSRGWIKELFESALGRTVEVLLEKSVINGDNLCRFRVLLQDPHP
jgi:predicted hydrocarbon binding protein